MRKTNVYKELSQKYHVMPAREIKIDFRNIEEVDETDWGVQDDILEEESPWEQAFSQGAEEAAFDERNAPEDD